jgi:hypothetical protein
LKNETDLVQPILNNKLMNKTKIKYAQIKILEPENLRFEINRFRVDDE